MPTFFFRTYRRLLRTRHRTSVASDRGRMVRTGAVVCAALGVDTDLTLIYQLFALLICLILVARVALALQKPVVAIRRRLPRYATAGEAFEYEVEVSNLGNTVEKDLRLTDNPTLQPPTLAAFQRQREPNEASRNAWDRFIGFHRFIWLLRLGTGIHIPERAVPDIGIAARVGVRIEATPLRRGLIHFRSTSILHPDPMGMNYGVTEFPNPEQLMVLPRRYAIPAHFNLAGGRQFQPGGVASNWTVGESDEFVSMREYRDGDPMRKVHWPSSARRNKLVIKEYQEEYLVRQALVLDTHTEDPVLLEEAISVAASLILRSRTDESMLDLIHVASQPVITTSGRGQTSINHQLETLACLTASARPVAVLSEVIQARIARLSGCVVVLCGWDGDRREMVERLQRSPASLAVLVLNHGGEDQIDVPSFVHVLDAAHVADGLRRL
jgi:uncharacterized protein (DUF58 family)